MKVLLADDEVTYRTVVMRECKKQGVDVRCANNGEEAIEWLKKETFDVVLLDYSMPIKSGMDVANYMSENGIKSPIFMISPRNLWNNLKSFAALNFLYWTI